MKTATMPVTGRSLRCDGGRLCNPCCAYGAAGEEASALEPEDPRRPQRMRDLAAFWIIGLVNNFAYVIMLSAAKDIIEKHEGSGGTGSILLADILPTLAIKLTAPFYMQRIPYLFRALTVIFFALASFIIVAFSHTFALSLFGVACASISAGFGEITFLALSSHYHKNTVSAWSSGTGGAGAIGALSYLGLTSFLSPEVTLLVMTVMPMALAVAYFGLLSRPDAPDTIVHCEDLLRLIRKQRADKEDRQEHIRLVGSEHPSATVAPATQDPAFFSRALSVSADTPQAAEGGHIKRMPLRRMLQLLLPLMKYMGPLFLVYYAEYLINLGLLQHIVFDVGWLEEKVRLDTRCVIVDRCP